MHRHRPKGSCFRRLYVVHGLQISYNLPCHHVRLLWSYEHVQAETYFQILTHDDAYAICGLLLDQNVLSITFRTATILPTFFLDKTTRSPPQLSSGKTSGPKRRCSFLHTCDGIHSWNMTAALQHRALRCFYHDRTEMPFYKTTLTNIRSPRCMPHRLHQGFALKFTPVLMGLNRRAKCK